MHDLAARTAVLALRWIARLWSLATILLVAAFIVGEGVNLSGRAQTVGFVLFPFGICIGMAFAWGHELVGGAITVGCLVAFYAVHLITTGTLPDGVAWLAFAAPGFLFLITWAMSRHQRPRNPIAVGGAALLVLLLAPSAWAQTPVEAPAAVPAVWAPITNNLHRDNIPRADERAAFRREFEAVLDVLRGTPALAAPTGVQIVTSIQNYGEALAAMDYIKGLPYPGYMQVLAYPLLCCPPKRAPYFQSGLWAVVNDPTAITGTRPHRDWAGIDFFLEPTLDGDRVTSHQGGGELKILTKRTAPLFVPVTVGAYINARLQDERARRTADEEPGVIETELGSALASSTPESLAREAYACLDLENIFTEVCSPSAPDARRVVVMNPGFWDRSLPPTSVQLLVVGLYGSKNPEARIIDAAWAQLDWSKLRALLR